MAHVQPDQKYYPDLGKDMVLFPQASLPSLNFNTMYIENGQLLSSTWHNIAWHNFLLTLNLF